MDHAATMRRMYELISAGDIDGFMGMPATGKRADVQLIDIIRFGDDGLAHEHWGLFDALKMMQQLGAIPEGPPA